MDCARRGRLLMTNRNCIIRFDRGHPPHAERLIVFQIAVLIPMKDLNSLVLGELTSHYRDESLNFVRHHLL